MEFYRVSTEKTLQEVNSSLSGLSEKQAAERKSLYGANELKEKKKRNLFLQFLSQFKDFMTILLMISALLSAVISFITKDKNEIVDTLILVFIVLLNNVVSFLQQYRADNAIEKMKKLSSCNSKVLRDKKVVLCNSVDLVPGDIVYFEEGDKITADCRILTAKNLKVNESALTGESAQVEKSEGILSKELPVAERKNMLFSSTFVTKGNATAVVTATGMQTEMGKIAHLVSTATVQPTPMEQALDKIGKVISYLVVGIACFIFVFGLFFRDIGILNNFTSSVAIAVAAIPEGLPAVVTILMALGVQRLSAERSIVRKLQAVETLGCCQVLCSDKTGTLTQNKMQVQEVCFYGNDAEILSIMRTCNSIKNEETGDETELALLRYQKGRGREEAYRKIDEIPFDSERKMMSVAVTGGGRSEIFCKGSVEVLLKKSAYFCENGKVTPMTETIRQKILSESSEMAKRALRVLGFAKRDYEGKMQEESLVFCGFCGLMDPPKESAYTAVNEAKRAGIVLIMITGDQKDTALAIARRLHIASTEDKVMTGEELDSLKGVALQNKIMRSRVFARVNPKHKGLIVETFQRSGLVVAMTGDGVNDAPALKKADIGVAMGSGTDVAKNVSDIVVTDDDLSTIVAAVREGRRIFANIKKTVAFYLATNLGEVLSILFVTLFMPQALFLTSTQLLWINLITDSFPVLALGAEKAEKDIMERSPERAEKTIFQPSFLLPVLIFGLLQAVMTVAVFAFSLSRWGNDEARTIAMLSMSFSELFYAFHVRTERSSIFGKKFFENKLLLVTVFLAGALSVILCRIPFLASVFGLTPLSFPTIALLVALSLLLVPLGELYKWGLRKKGKVSIKRFFGERRAGMKTSEGT